MISAAVDRPYLCFRSRGHVMPLSRLMGHGSLAIVQRYLVQMDDDLKTICQDMNLIRLNGSGLSVNIKRRMMGDLPTQEDANLLSCMRSDSMVAKALQLRE